MVQEFDRTMDYHENVKTMWCPDSCNSSSPILGLVTGLNNRDYI